MDNEIKQLKINKQYIDMSMLTEETLNHFGVSLSIDDGDIVLKGEMQDLTDLLLYCANMDIDALNDILSKAVVINEEENKKVYLVKASSEDIAISKVAKKIKESYDVVDAINTLIAYIDSTGGFEGYQELRSKIMSIIKK